MHSECHQNGCLWFDKGRTFIIFTQKIHVPLIENSGSQFATSCCSCVLNNSMLPNILGGVAAMLEPPSAVHLLLASSWLAQWAQRITWEPVSWTSPQTRRFTMDLLIVWSRLWEMTVFSVFGEVLFPFGLDLHLKPLYSYLLLSSYTESVVSNQFNYRKCVPPFGTQIWNRHPFFISATALFISKTSAQREHHRTRIFLYRHSNEMPTLLDVETQNGTAFGPQISSVGNRSYT